MPAEQQGIALIDHRNRRERIRGNLSKKLRRMLRGGGKVETGEVRGEVKGRGMGKN